MNNSNNSFLAYYMVLLQVKIGFYNHGQPFRFHIHTMSYSQVKLSWIFLGVSLVSSAVIFPAFKFSPPRYPRHAYYRMGVAIYYNFDYSYAGYMEYY